MQIAFGRGGNEGPHLSRPSPCGNLNILNQLSTISSVVHAPSHYGTAKIMKWMLSPDHMHQLF